MAAAIPHLWVCLGDLLLTYAHRQGPCIPHRCNNQSSSLDSCDESLLSSAPEPEENKLIRYLPKLATNLGGWLYLIKHYLCQELSYTLIGRLRP
jgi:hypothetical protein